MPTAPPSDPVRAYSFTDHSTNNPTTPHQGDKLDAEFDRTNAAVAQLVDWVQQALTDTGTLKPDTVGDAQIVDGTVVTATSTALETYVQLGQAWAEHMPGTIPPNLLSEMAVTGDHWSSRFWAHQAALVVQTLDPNILEPGTASLSVGHISATTGAVGTLSATSATVDTLSATSASVATLITLGHIATPSAPTVGTSVYAKSDGKLYRRAAAGGEVEILDAADTFDTLTATVVKATTLRDANDVDASVEAVVRAATEGWETGDYKHTARANAPAGWVFADGRTIGNGSSGATSRANADTEALFLLLYQDYGDAILPVSGGRGASAAADFAANKTITLPDLRGRALFGHDNPTGSSAAGRITASGTGHPGINGAQLGAAGGADRRTLTTAQIPSHTHGSVLRRTGGQYYTTSAAAGVNGVAATGDNTDNNTDATGGGEAFPAMPPTLICKILIKL